MVGVGECQAVEFELYLVDKRELWTFVNGSGVMQI